MGVRKAPHDVLIREEITGWRETVSWVSCTETQGKTQRYIKYIRITGILHNQESASSAGRHSSTRAIAVYESC
jgi:hypothetical protein